MKFKILFQKVFFISHWKGIILFFWVEVFKSKRFFISYWKNIIFSSKHRVYILKGFKSHIKKIKHSSNIYIVNFKIGY